MLEGYVAETLSAITIIILTFLYTQRKNIRKLIMHVLRSPLKVLKIIISAGAFTICLATISPLLIPPEIVSPDEDLSQLLPKQEINEVFELTKDINIDNAELVRRLEVQDLIVDVEYIESLGRIGGRRHVYSVNNPCNFSGIVQASFTVSSHNKVRDAERYLDAKRRGFESQQTRFFRAKDSDSLGDNYFLEKDEYPFWKCDPNDNNYGAVLQSMFITFSRSNIVATIEHTYVKNSMSESEVLELEEYFVGRISDRIDSVSD